MSIEKENKTQRNIFLDESQMWIMEFPDIKGAFKVFI
jgi:hypothetical protein